MAGFQRNVKKAWDNSQDPNFNHSQARSNMLDLMKRGLINAIPGLAAYNYADSFMPDFNFKDGIRTNEQARSAGQPRLSPTTPRISNNDIIPARIPDYGGGLAGGVDPMQIIAAANAAARNVPAPVVPSNSDFMVKLAADSAEADAIKEMGVDDSIKDAPTAPVAKSKRKTKRKTKTKAKEVKNTAQEAINKSAGIVPKRRMTHADRLAMLSPEYAQDPNYGITY